MTDSMDILVTASVFPEVEALVKHLGIAPGPDLGGRPFYYGVWKETSVGVLITGPGMINAAQALTAALEHGCPGQIIHTGCAGMFTSSGGDIGDLALAISETDIHTGLEQDRDIIPAPLPFALLEADSGPLSGTYPLDTDAVKRAKTTLEKIFKPDSMRIFQGPFITVSTVTTTDRRAEILTRAFSPVMESMEGASAAHVAMLYRVPFLEIRAASNRVGRRDTATWDLPLSFERCSHAVFHLIDRFDQWRPNHD